ncbi:MAG: hypothetical protein ABIS14_04775 [Sphingomonas sp.]
MDEEGAAEAAAEDCTASEGETVQISPKTIIVRAFVIDLKIALGRPLSRSLVAFENTIIRIVLPPDLPPLFKLHQDDERPRRESTSFKNVFGCVHG